jgi:hypothetical protein
MRPSGGLAPCCPSLKAVLCPMMGSDGHRSQEAAGSSQGRQPSNRASRQLGGQRGPYDFHYVSPASELLDSFNDGAIDPSGTRQQQEGLYEHARRLPAPPPGPRFQHPPQGVAYRTDNDPTIALVCGILSLVFCGIFTAIPAIIYGKRVRSDVSHPQRGFGTAGFIMGWISVVMNVLVVVAWVILVSTRASTS